MDYSLRDNARLEALELADRLLRAAMMQRAFGRLEICFADGLVTLVREERTHKIGQSPAAERAA
jgi:hypothetical protein